MSKSMPNADEPLEQRIALLRQHSDGSPEDELLCQIITAVWSHPYGSRVWRRQMNRMLYEVQQLPDLARSSHPNYLDALNRTWEWFSSNIQNYNPRSPSIRASLLKWVNSHIYWRIKDLYAPDNQAPLQFLENEEGETYEPSDRRLSGLDKLVAEVKQQVLIELEKYVEQEPEKRLQNCHPKTNTACHCQLLAQRVLFAEPPEKFSDIVRDLNVNYQTLKSHWERRCKPLLQEICQEIAHRLGYTLEEL